jgi:hypothetical protein
MKQDEVTSLLSMINVGYELNLYIKTITKYPLVNSILDLKSIQTYTFTTQTPSM